MLIHPLCTVVESTGGAAATCGCGCGLGVCGLGIGFGDYGLGLDTCGIVNITAAPCWLRGLMRP